MLHRHRNLILALIGALVLAFALSAGLATRDPGSSASRATEDQALVGQPDGGAAKSVMPEAADSAGGERDVAASGSVDSAPLQEAAGLKIIRTGDLEVVVGNDRLDSSIARVTNVATGMGGYVVSTTSSLYGDDAHATLQLRVPAGKFDAAITALAKVGKVESRSLSGQDVTREYVDSESRLRHAEAVEGRLLAILSKAKTIADTLAIQDRLNQVQQQIELEKGQLAYFDKLTQLATINVTLSEKPGADKPDQKSTLSKAWQDAKDGFSGTLAGFIALSGSALAWLMMFALVGGVWLIVARARRRRAEGKTGDDMTS